MSTSNISSQHVQDAIHTAMVRELQRDSVSESRGRTILTILYLCVLGLCFVTPVIYYVKMHFEERNSERSRELENAMIRASLEQSDQLRDEARATRRKYVVERRARILQLFEPVRMIMKPENFPDLKDIKAGDGREAKTDTSIDKVGGSGEKGSKKKKVPALKDSKGKNAPASTTASISVKVVEECMSDEEEESHNPYGDDDIMVKLPAPGLHYVTATEEHEQRLVSGLCTICLSTYKVGSDVVWSSNAACEHAFHHECIEKWLMKQREGPLCPCCRRDFIVDPFDVEEGRDEQTTTPPMTGTLQSVWNDSIAIDINDDDEMYR